MSMVKIKLGDPQPEPCSKCGEKMGYQVSDYIKTHYTSIYNVHGESIGGFYSEHQPTINKGKTACCWNCQEELKFRIDRT